MTIEAVRISLKIHSYFRNKLLYCTENKYKHFIPKDLKGSLKIEDLNIPETNLGSIFVEIKRFSYYFIAPTLIYRDSYIKYNLRNGSTKRDYKFLAANLMNFLLTIYFAFLLCKSYVFPLADEFRKEELTVGNFFSKSLVIIVPSITWLFLGFFGFLHSW